MEQSIFEFQISSGKSDPFSRNCNFTIALVILQQLWTKVYTNSKYARKIYPLTFVLISCFEPHQSKWVISYPISYCGFPIILRKCKPKKYFVNPRVIDPTNADEFSPFRKISVFTITRWCFKVLDKNFVVVFIIVPVCDLYTW